MWALAEGVDWKRNETEKKNKQKQRNKHFGIAMQKRTLKLFVNELLIKK